MLGMDLNGYNNSKRKLFKSLNESQWQKKNKIFVSVCVIVWEVSFGQKAYPIWRESNMKGHQCRSVEGALHLGLLD